MVLCRELPDVLHYEAWRYHPSDCPILVERATLFIRQRTSPLKATKKSTTKTASLAILREYGLPCIPDLWLGRCSLYNRPVITTLQRR